ncbi:PaaI family thioesterase [Roseomonas hellenica]|uniref:PaaI family thioesterase n=1 Tax=Plastoroseomonas hellenica TaxID=2687306 RepID=A0ABS5F7I1_9PROT|nr:PaaI family thioesterase [Plastoroseomonas hellenica]MBR0668519.1 PaaI family thioesterase [Plastoroseomonas hellenica]
MPQDTDSTGASRRPAFDPIAAGWQELPERGFPVHVGTFYVKQAEAGWRYGFVAEPRHANVGGVVHGGMLMTFMDDMLGVTVWQAVERQPVSTIQLNSGFVSPARPGDFVECVPELQRVTRSVVFIRGELFVGGRLVMSADGVWKVLGK